MNSFKKEFPEFQLSVDIPAGLSDTSWRNEITSSWECPTLDGRSVKLWVFNADSALRDLDADGMPEGHQFILSICSENGDIEDDVLKTSHYSDVLEYIDELKRVTEVYKAFVSLRLSSPTMSSREAMHSIDPTSGEVHTGGGCTAIATKECYGNKILPYLMICEDGESHIAETIGESSIGLYLYDGDCGLMEENFLSSVG
jgi:hypothetical protein